MTLSAEAIASFKEIYTHQFNEQISDSEAEAKALSMLRLFRLVYSKAAPRGWLNQTARKESENYAKTNVQAANVT